jgi:hypothetical protein
MFVLVDKKSVSKFRTYFINHIFQIVKGFLRDYLFFRLPDNWLAPVEVRASLAGACRTLAIFSLHPMYGTPGTSASTLFLNSRILASL